MNKFIWNITFKWNVNFKDLKYKYLQVKWIELVCTIFVYWKTLLESSDKLQEEFALFWEILNYDISFDKEDNIVILNDDIEEGIYELVSFEWPEVDFIDIKDRFEDVYEVISVREAEESSIYWNRIVKVDFVY